jgi:hypothetical protein
MADNRILEAARQEEGPRRANAYDELDHQIATAQVPSLSGEEGQALVDALAHESNRRARAFLWRLLVRAPRDPRIRELALATLENPGALYRGPALQYLRDRYPELMPHLFVKHEHHPDPAVQYQLAKYVEGHDPVAAIDRMINILPTDSHELGDSLWLEISEGGDATHLEKLRERDQASGGGSIFGKVAEALELRMNEATQRRGSP